MLIKPRDSPSQAGVIDSSRYASSKLVEIHRVIAATSLTTRETPLEVHEDVAELAMNETSIRPSRRVAYDFSNFRRFLEIPGEFPVSGSADRSARLFQEPAAMLPPVASRINAVGEQTTVTGRIHGLLNSCEFESANLVNSVAAGAMQTIGRAKQPAANYPRPLFRLPCPGYRRVTSIYSDNFFVRITWNKGGSLEGNFPLSAARTFLTITDCNNRPSVAAGH